MLLHGLRSTVRRHIRRRRRPIAAALAALAVLAGLASIDRPAASEAVVPFDGTTARSALERGEVAVPVELSTSSLVQALAVGDVVDLVGISGAETATASVVAPDARVIDLPSAGGFGSSSSAVVVLAVDESAALTVTAASAAGALTVLIRSRAAR